MQKEKRTSRQKNIDDVPIQSGSKSATHAASNQGDYSDPLKQQKIEQKSLFYQKDQLSNRLKLMRDQQSETLQKIEAVQNKAYSVYLTKVSKDELKSMMEERAKKQQVELAEMKQKVQQLKEDPKKKEENRIKNLITYNSQINQEYKLFQKNAKKNDLKEKEIRENQEKKKKVLESEIIAKKRIEKFQKERIQQLQEQKKKDNESKKLEAQKLIQEADKLQTIEKQLEQKVNTLKK